MSSVVFILGAGASKQSGAPLMGNFLDVAYDLLRSGAVKDTQVHFERVFDTIGKLQAVHSKAQLDLTNIETVFTAFVLGHIIQKLPGVSVEEIPQAIRSLKELIVHTLEATIKFPTRRSQIGVPEPYEQFAHLLNYLRAEAKPVHTVSVITFNYDIAIDMALFQANSGPDYVIEAAPGRYTQIGLMKLHGSLNWASVAETGAIKPVHLQSYFQHFSFRGFDEHGTCTVPIGSQIMEFFSETKGPKVSPEPVIVPPT